MILRAIGFFTPHWQYSLKPEIGFYNPNIELQEDLDIVFR